MVIIQLSWKLITIAVISMVTCFAKPKQVSGNKDSATLFVGTTPCGNMIRPLHKIKPEPDCAFADCKCLLVEWKLTLYRDPGTEAPTRYQLTGINRFGVKETNMYSQPGTKTESEGKWTIMQGTKTNPAATVFRLNPDKPEIALDFLQLSDHLIHALDHEGKLLIGDEFQSYTLNRVTHLNE
jgi:hypothetical protein